MQDDVKAVERELRELLAKATPLPWCRVNIANVTTHINPKGCRAFGRDLPVETQRYTVGDVALATSAVNAVPRLLDTLAALQERCERLEEFVATIANGSAFRDQRFAEDDDAEYFLRVQRRVATLARTLTPDFSGAYSMSPEDADPSKLEPLTPPHDARNIDQGGNHA